MNVNHLKIYEKTNNNFELKDSTFLTDQMIDVGGVSKPLFYDYNKDGLVDILIGRRSSWDGETKIDGGISLYENIGTLDKPVFNFIEDDIFKLSELPEMGKELEWHSTFGDLDNDGDDDMIVGTWFRTYLAYFENISTEIHNPEFVLKDDQFLNTLERGNTPQLVDVNKDGMLDLVVGGQSGKVQYFQNKGTKEMPNFDLVSDFWGEVSVAASISFSGYSNPLLFDLYKDNNYELLVGNLDGKIFLYDGIENAVEEGAFQLIDTFFANVNTTFKNSLSIADINNDKAYEMIVGNYRGGLECLSQNSKAFLPSTQVTYPTIDLKEPFVKIFNSPAQTYIGIQCINFNSKINLNYQIFGSSGRVFLIGQVKQSYKKINIEELSNGIFYIIINNHIKNWASPILIVK